MHRSMYFHLVDMPMPVKCIDTAGSNAVADLRRLQVTGRQHLQLVDERNSAATLEEIDEQLAKLLQDNYNKVKALLQRNR